MKVSSRECRLFECHLDLAQNLFLDLAESRRSSHEQRAQIVVESVLLAVHSENVLGHPRALAINTANNSIRIFGSSPRLLFLPWLVVVVGFVGVVGARVFGVFVAVKNR